MIPVIADSMRDLPGGLGANGCGREGFGFFM